MELFKSSVVIFYHLQIKNYNVPLDSLSLPDILNTIILKKKIINKVKIIINFINLKIFFYLCIYNFSK